MGAMIRAFDWGTTAVGPVERWPQSLRTAVSILLASGYPMYIAWGPDLVQFYNDAYRPILGARKHPAALGQGTRECFVEIWEIIGPMFERVMSRGEATSYHDFLLPLDRFGYVEECYFDFSYSAVRDESAGIGGVFVTCSETTGRVLSERRLRTLRELAADLSGATTAEDACRRAARALASNPSDLPLLLLYLVDERTGTARLAGGAGIQTGGDAGLESLVLAAADPGSGVKPPACWPVAEVVAGGGPLLVDDLAARFGRLEGGPWPEPVTRAYLLPIRPTGQVDGQEVTGVLVAGISPRLAFDEDYRGFVDLVAGQVATAVASARSYAEAVARAEALAELDRAKTAFFSNISHEFRTPLTLSLAPLEDILREDASAVAAGTAGLRAPDRERLTLVHRNSLRLLKLVNSLLDFSRIEAGRIRAAYEPADLARLTADHAAAFRSAFERAGLALKVDCPPLGRPVHVDPEMWEKVVLNLLSNAFKFTLSGGVRVAVTESASAAVVSVSDTGVGIPAEELPHVFERFHRVRGARSRSFEGTGIGLALVRELVQLHGGTI